jgi:DUF1680 family protein
MRVAALYGLALRWPRDAAVASESSAAGAPAASSERLAAALASRYRAYRSRTSHSSEVNTWVQIDLQSSQPIDFVRLYPLSKPNFPPGNAFPLRLRIECSNAPDFKQKRVLADSSKKDYPHPGDRIVEFPARKMSARYVRLTVTRLRHEELPPQVTGAAEAVRKPFEDSIRNRYVFQLAKIEVLANGIDLAMLQPVSVDEAYGNTNDAQQLTRALRPQGEGIVTDNPGNVTTPQSWRPAVYCAQPPSTGVRLEAGLFMTALQNNVRYLLDSFTVDELLRQFRLRAGKADPSEGRQRKQNAWFWEDVLAGSNAGRFLMGAANTLHWVESEELRERMNAVVAGIGECRQANGYIMGYPEDTFFYEERGAYTRAWVTHGLIDAGFAGNTQAFELLRGYYDWFNTMPYLPEALRGCNQGVQGIIANARMYFTPQGKPADLQVLQRYFQENYWLEDLAARREDALWQYPYDRPHSYLLTPLEAYLDLYRATGDPRYLNAVLGAWDLLRENWQNTGGSISLIEGPSCPPKSNSLYDKRGETCGSAFWVLLNHRLHLLSPEEEKYVTEIEKSIYNVLLANQAKSQGFRYHSVLVGKKEGATCDNTCCEGQGTRLVGSLSEFIYSIAEDGVYINLFAPATLDWHQSGEALQLKMQTDFPNSPNVRLALQLSKPMSAKIRIRIPSWAAGVMTIEVNGKRVATGIPGSYATLDQLWSHGDVISFVLPMSFKLTQYTGVDQIAGRERYALEYGPLLMAAVGAAERELVILNAVSPMELVQQLQPGKDQPLHFTAPLMDTMWIPYFEVDTESFSCFPIIEARPL